MNISDFIDSLNGAEVNIFEAVATLEKEIDAMNEVDYDIFVRQSLLAVMAIMGAQDGEPIMRFHRTIMSVACSMPADKPHCYYFWVNVATLLREGAAGESVH